VRPDTNQPVSIVGAGLAGALLAVLLARRRFSVRLYDRRLDPRLGNTERGRSINLALAARGIRALERAGVMERVRPLLIPMRGRMVHELSGSAALQPYGQREDEVIYSVGRAALNRVLIEEAARLETVTLRFDETCLEVIADRNLLRLRNQISGIKHETSLAPTIAADGAGSAVRASLAAARLLTVREERLEHDYKELTIPGAGGRHVLEPHALHVWPRRGFMLIALPNTDGSFTATLFLARTGRDSFAALATSEAVEEFFVREFADAVPLMPDLLLGDAAHAIVPFHGQGMNAAFEDCLVLDRLLDHHEAWGTLFEEFEESRRPNAAAIAQMALENYTEMRDSVLEPGFVHRKALAMELERRFPDRFIPRYSMVMFHAEIPYTEAQRRGAVQEQLLEALDALPNASGTTDFGLAAKLIIERLTPLA